MTTELGLEVNWIKVAIASDLGLTTGQTLRDTIFRAMDTYDQTRAFHIRSAIKRPFERLSFSQQFLLASATVLVVGMSIIGTWIGRQIESSAINRAASIAAVYVESILAAQLHDWPGAVMLGSDTHAALDRVFIEGPLRRKVVRFKLWDAGGNIIYSSDHAQMGRRFSVEGRLAAAFSGTLQARISELDDADNLPERKHWPRLLEVYVPVRDGAQGEIIAVAEFYHSTENLGRDIRRAQQRSWLLVAIATVTIYLLLLGLVRRANDTILDQRHDLQLQLQQLRAALEENERMRERLRDAGARTTTLNEEFLHRVAADLHDGPAQEIALALMRFGELADACTGCALPEGDPSLDLRTIHDALRSALEEVRNIASGLGMPGIGELSLADAARRAVRDFERMSGQTVQAAVDESPDQAPLAIKIAVFRLLQESLANCWRHAPGGAPSVCVRHAGGQVLVEVTDQGAGFDPQAVAGSGRLGLAFMRERVRLLGGSVEVNSAPGRGTSIRARLPLSSEEVLHG